MVEGAAADSPPAILAPGFVGRARESAALREALARQPAVVLVEGEAGIGKSRLLHEHLATLPPARRRQVLMSTCAPLRESLTLAPILDALRQTQQRVAELGLSDLAGALRPLFPEWSAELPPPPEPLSDARAARHRLFRALAELVGALAPELLVVEDVHWADEVTLEFLLYLSTRAQPDGLNLVLSYRPEEVDDQSLLLRLSSRLPAGSTQLRISLAPLDPAATAAFVSSMLGGEPVSTDFAEFIHARTDGVPLAVEESVRLLCDRGDLVFRRGQWVRLTLDELQVPPTVRDSTRERVGRLTTAAQDVLRAAAVLAEPSPEAILAATTGLPPPAYRAGLTEAVTAGLLDGDDHGQWRFRHLLAATTVYEAIPRPARQTLHLRAGRALEAVEQPPVSQLARHFREAGEPAAWAYYAEQAAERAIASGDHTAAVALLDDVLTEVDLPAADRTRLALVAGSAALGRPDAVDALYHRLVGTLRTVLTSPDLTARQQAEVRNLQGRLLINGGEPEAALVELERAVEHLDDPFEAAQAMTYLGWAYAGPWPATTHLHWLRRAADLTPRVESATDRLSLLGDRAAALLMLGEEDAWTVVAEIPTDPAGAVTAQERRQIARINTNIGTGALIWGRYEPARQHLSAALALAEADHLVRLRYSILLELANLDWFTGRWQDLEQRASELADADRDRPSMYLASVRLRARLAAAAGRWRAAENQFRLVLDEADRLGAADDTMEPAAALARLRLAEQATAEALRVTDRPIQIVSAKRVWVWATDLVPVRVQALLAAGKPEPAARLVAQFARGLRRRDAPGPRAALAVCRALLAAAAGDHTAAAAGFGRAAAAWEALPRPYDALLARERQAHALMAAGQPGPGRELLAQVYTGLFELGARGDADRVAQGLREHGAGVPRLWRGGRKGYGDRLSPRELEVVQLVVAGKTNREIGRILSKSPATVDQQLRSAMRKLGVASRTAVAVTAVESGVFSGPEYPSPRRDGPGPRPL